MDFIRHYLKQFFPLPISDWHIFSSRLTAQDFAKNEIILPVGKVEKHLCFIEKGMVRQYLPLEDKDITFGFAFQHEVACGYDSFLTQTPSLYELQALAPTRVWKISYDDLQEVYQTSEYGVEIGRLIAEALYLKKSKREISFLKDSAEQRYDRLFTDRPALFENIPMKYIASYIGVTPQALSRIRNRIS